jgi:hypothetical protein
MRIALVGALSALVMMCLAGLFGCGKGQNPAGESVAADHEHAHEEVGPHNGHIIELGADGYHAELIHEDAEHRVGVYILDGSAKAAAPIDAKSIAIHVSIGDQPSEYELPAVAQAGDQEGKASYFELVSEPLCKVVCGEEEDARARLKIMLDGKPYHGIIETEHEHDHGHDHSHPHSHDHDDDHGHE